MDTAPIPPQPDITEDDAPAMAGTLQSLLSEISDRVSLADRRYADIITEMQNKLSALDALAKATREQAEEEARQKKAEDEADAALKAKEAAEQQAQTQEHAHTGAIRKPQDTGVPEDENADLTSAIDLAKKDAAAAFARHKATYDRDVDPFDIIDHAPAQPREPWDSVTADVFTRHFEETTRSPEAEPSRQLTSYQPQRELDETGYGRSIAPQEQSPERAWLEGRFNDIANRITEMMDAGGTGLGARFDSFENRLDKAMTTVTSQAISGSETLKQIEAHIVEIDEHVDFIRGELARLDKVEEHIRSLLERRDESEKEEPEAASARTDGETAPAQAQSSPDAGIAQLSDLLQHLMDERRHTEEHTVSMLDTLQQAMIRVLDRMDAIESGSSEPAAKTEAEANSKDQDLADISKAGETEHAQPQAPDSHDDIEQALQNLIDQPEAAIAPEQSAAPPQVAPQQIGHNSQSAQEDPIQPPEPQAQTAGNVHHLPQHHHPHAPAAEDDDSFFVETEDWQQSAAEYPSAANYQTSHPDHRPELQNSISQIRRNFIADTRRTQQQPEEQPRARQHAPRPRAAVPPRTSLWKKLLRPSTKQLAIAAIGLMVPLNAMFLYIILARSDQPDQPGTQTAAQQMDMLAQELTDASRAASSEPPVSQAPDITPAIQSLNRINPQDLASQPIALTPTEDEQASGPARLPPATIGPLSLRQAAAQGDPSAQFEVAARFAEGKGIDQDFKSAVQWYLRSASSGFAQAQYRLGTHYERALGVDKDAERARIWYGRAAAQGNVKAMHNLAVLASGSSGSPDYSEAVTWFTKAAEHNLPDSQFNLAVLYQNGLGVETDIKAAYYWFSLAARNGDSEAVRRREAVKSQLSADAVRLADQEVTTFQAKKQIPVINDARVAGEQWKRAAASGN